MTAEEYEFYESVFPEPYTVLGLRLRPFCLGHKVLLHRFGSVFVEGGAEPTYDDLALSVYICHHSFEEAVAALNSPDLDWTLADWYRQLERPSWAHRLRLRKPRLIDFPGECRKFWTYLAEQNKVPCYSYKDSGSTDSGGAPGDQFLLTAVMGNGATYSEAMNMPYSVAMRVYITSRAMEGAISLTSREALNNAHEAGKAMYEELVRQGVIKENGGSSG